MMENVRKISKKYYVRQIVACWLVLWMGLGLPLQVAMATPQGGAFTVGTGTIVDNVQHSTVEVEQMASVIQWGSPGYGGINTDSSESLSFSQKAGLGLSNSAVMNRIMSGNPTQFYGALNGVDMRIFVVNPAGIIFDCGASVNVNQLVASALPMSDPDFLTAVTDPSAKMKFGPGSGDVTIGMTLDATGSGSLYFVGENVTNNGTIVCPDGLVVMAAGEEMLLGQPGSDVIVQVADLTAGPGNQVYNYGDVGGENENRVRKLVLAAGDVWSAAIEKTVEQVAAVSKAGDVYFNGDVYAYDDGGSDAVADVTIITAGDFDTDYDITAEADAPTGFNSFASVTIDAGGDVTIDERVKAEADAEDGAINATATVNIIADGYVEIDDAGKGEDVQADAWVDNDNSGDGTATVNITAGEYVKIQGDIKAEAEADEGTSGDMRATVDIDAGDYVEVKSGSSTTVEAKAEDGANNYADVLINAVGDVSVLATDGDVTIKAEADSDDNDGALNQADVEITGDSVTVKAYEDGWRDDALIKAEAHDAGQNIANVKITANDLDDDDKDNGNVTVECADPWSLGDDALIEALAHAHEGTTNTADIDITATDIVEVIAYGGGFEEALIKAEAWNEIELDPDIPAPDDSEVVVVDLDTIEGLVNTATVDITASMVEIRGELEVFGKAAVEAIARNDIEVDIENNDGEVAVNLTVADLVNTAAVTITANNKETAEYDDGDVLVTAKTLGNAGIKADAYNEIEIKHHKYTEDLATMNLTLDGLENNADVVINADDDVEVTSENWLSNAEIEAKAWNELEIDEGYKGGDTTVNLTAHDLRNDADVAITTALDSVLVSGLSSGDAGIRAEAKNETEIDEAYKGGETTFNLTVDVDGLVRNDADVVINAAVDVEVQAQCEGDCSEAEIIALANNWLDDVDLLAVEETGLVENNAGIDITAGEDVRVIAIDCGEATIAAVAENEDLDLTADGLVENNADVVINAGDDVLVQAVGGKHSQRSGFTPSQASIEAVAKHANGQTAENDADVTIGATKVEVAAESGGDAVIGATAQHVDGEDSANNADVTITTSGDVLVKASGVGSGPPSQAAIEATAMYGTNNNNAGVTVTAGGNVEVAGGVDDRRGIAGIVAETMYATNNTSDVTINATNVKVTAGNPVEGYKGTAEIKAEAEYGENNDADVTITADGDVLVHARTSEETAQIRAEAMYGNNNTADITINAGGDVEVKAGDALYEHRGKAEIVAAATHGTTTTADVTINAGGDVKVIDLYGGGKTAKIKAKAEASNNATALVDIEAGNVYVGGDGVADIRTEASVCNDQEGVAPGDATATTKIDVGSGNVTLYGDVEADAYVWNYYGDFEGAAGDVTATVDIDAGNITVGMDGDIEATVEMYNDDQGSDGTFSGVAKAEVDITTGVLLVETGGEIDADSDIDNANDSLYSGDAIAVIDIVAAGDVTVEEGDDEGDGIVADADIDNYDDSATNTFSGNADADVYITTPGVVTVDGLVKARADIDNEDRGEADTYSGSAYANVWIDNILGDGVTVGPEGKIKASADIYITDNYHESIPTSDSDDDTYSGDAYAGVDIESCGDVIVDGVIRSEADITEWADNNRENDEYSNDTEADVIIKAYGDVIVNSEDEEEENGPLFLLGDDGPGGQILALASDGEENTADITILAVGDVIVNDGHGFNSIGEIESSDVFGPEEISALAGNGSTNNAFVGIATRGGGDHGRPGDVIVDGQIGAHTGKFGSEASTNTSSVEISAARDVIVDGGHEVWGETVNPGPVLLDSEAGGRILAEASSSGPEHQGEPENFNTANVEIFAGRDVIVHDVTTEYVEILPASTELEVQFNGDVSGGQILALTPVECLNNDSVNTSTIGIYAGRDVTVEGPPITMDSFEMSMNGDASGLIEAGAHGNSSINTALIDICAGDDVIVDGEIIAEAGTGINGVAHNAHITIAAGNADPGGPGGIGGSGYIEADADENAKQHAESITFIVTPLGSVTFDGITIPEAAEIEVPVLDCPDCDFDWIDWTWCEDCEEAELIPAAAIVPIVTPMIAGCPAEMGAAALELEITPETIQVAIADALALNPSIQPCQACAALIDAAAILRDEDGSRMAAMLAVFNELAPADAPFTPEMGASIATAFSGAAEGSQYASVAEYVDAFVRYVAVVDVDLGSPIDDSLAFVMDKYGTGITESENSNLAAFVAARLEAGGTLAP